MDRTGIARSCKTWREQGRRIVFTNGCFDLLHAGHVRYLFAARKMGDILVVGLNTDDSVRRLKGPDRPVTTQEDRAEILAALSCVDAVTLFDEDTPLRLIETITPHVLVKGADWAPDEVVGRRHVEAHGGKVITVPLSKGRSTTGLLDKIKDTQQ
ncbi:MAG: D-glycero-beta-D-manno-heptose 1-phosphate adenylyltransferase [Acidobacteriota bacterium]|jgi:rfaE bifunctional protein nucleotidyltransferase chain/domain